MEELAIQLMEQGYQLVGSSLVDEIAFIKDGTPPIGTIRYMDNLRWRDMTPEMARRYPECLRDVPKVVVIETLIDAFGRGDRVTLAWRRDVYIESVCCMSEEAE